MPSSQSHFQPPPPIRTNTFGSQKSVSSGAMSPDVVSPSSTFSRGGRSVASPTEESFFGAIATRVRNARSRSRSRHAGSRTRSKSPYQMPPEHFPSTSSGQPTSPTYASARPQQPRHASSACRTSTSSSSSKAQRPSIEGIQRRSTSGSDMWRGRHSNSWLFNDFSVTGTANKVLHIGQRKG
ncbi:hypothetical protein BDV96DRAFT_600804 [Lophiotrema nucula]|uniref:Uncharacterized protein n=1 Tax=Lophiotrema nucula TaxID=690887 RepID=A0A6A5Z4Y3_9PLEO|nr:hypothetical protein BDV96DRAFT_600804 [Lophiotrema nucula]